jgi:hypothetical protein
MGFRFPYVPVLWKRAAAEKSFSRRSHIRKASLVELFFGGPRRNVPGF